MAFGQQSGPPASQRQLKDLGALLEQAGYGSFREARGPFGLSQRQGGGKFTVAEADELIERLEGEAEVARLEAEGAGEVPVTKPEPAPPMRRVPPARAAARPAVRRGVEPRRPSPVHDLSEVPADAMARELERRGWIVIPAEEHTTPAPPAP